MKLKYLAAAWGLAEATVFFIVPDVLLTFLALKDGKRATVVSFWTLGGALVGGIIMFCWGAHDKEAAEELLSEIPAISPAMLEKVETQVEEAGVKAAFVGPLTGRPYKIYATYAGSSGESLGIFLLISVPARLLRFLILAWLTTAIAKGPLRKVKVGPRNLLFVAIWLTFYVWYFGAM